MSSFLVALQGKRILVLGHVNCDVDAMASGCALVSALSPRFSISMGVPDHCNQAAARLASQLKISFEINPSLDSVDGLILVDFNEASRTGSLEAALRSFSKPVLVLDHHRRSSRSLSTSFGVWNEQSLSAASVVFTELQKAGLLSKPAVCLSLAAGMVSDSNDLLLSDAILLDQLSFCLKKARVSVADVRARYALSIPVSEKIAKLKALHRLRLFAWKDCLIAVSHTAFFEAQSAMALVNLGADIALVAGVDKKSGWCKLVVRASFLATSLYGFHAARDLCISLAQEHGGQGNGHAGAAGLSVKAVSADQVLELALDKVTHFFLQKEKGVLVKEVI